MNVKIIHTADNHLDPVISRFKYRINERRQDFWRCFREIIDYALKRKPDIFLIAGDLFDRVNPRNPPRVQLIRSFRSLYNAGVKVFIIGGHHDTPKSVEDGASPIDELEASGYVTYFSTRQHTSVEHVHVNGLDVCISGATYNFSLEGNADPLQTVRPAIEGDVNIFLAHYNIEGFNISAKTSKDPIIRLSSIPKGLDYLAAGHLHRHQEKKVGDTLIVYPGSTERKSFLEENDEKKGFIWLEFNENGIVNKEFVEVNARRMMTVKCNLEHCQGDPRSYILKEVEKYNNPDLILRLQISGDVPLEILEKYRRDEILLELLNKFFLVVIDDSKLTFARMPEIRFIEQQTPIDAFLSYINEIIKKETDENKRKILERAKEISEKYLREAGGW